MFDALSTLLLVGSALKTATAVFQDEAYKVDWEYQNLGDYSAVSKSHLQPNELIVLSQIAEGVSLLSSIDSTNGELLTRKLLDSEYYDLMVDYKNNKTENLILKGYEDLVEVIDFSTWLPVSNYTVPPFHSSALQSIGDRFTAEDNYFIVLDEEKKNTILKNNLNMSVSNLVYHYLNTDYVSEVEMLVRNYDSDVYHFFKFENGVVKTHWTKDESTSNVVSSVIVAPQKKIEKDSIDFVKEEESVSNNIQSVFTAYVDRLKHNINKFKKNIVIEQKLSFGSLVLDLFAEDKSPLGIAKRDLNFGFTQYLIVAKNDGLLTCLNVKDGTNVWNFKTDLKIKKIVKSSSDSILTVFSKYAEMLELDISQITNKPVIIKKQPSLVEGELEKIVPLQDNTIFIKNNEGEKLLINNLGNIEHKNESDIIVEHDATKLIAYQAGNGQDGLKKLWEYIPGKEIVSVAHKDQDEVISNIGVILGNRTVLYKYLYPHLFSVATIDKETQTLTVDIIDAMTGNLIKSVQHDESVSLETPIEMVFGENWVVYSYFAQNPIPEQRLSVIEFYESLTPNERISSENEIQDPYGYTSEPVVLTQSYLYPEVISKMTLSKTKFGISSKSIICELENGQITFIPKYVISARRKNEKDMTDDDKMEFMATPYFSTIPINDHTVITHNRELLPVNENSQLVSFPTKLESTSYVCSIGYDVFCTRISPSSQFDILPSTFERGQIMLTIIGLFAALYVVKPWVETKKLKMKWQVKDK